MTYTAIPTSDIDADSPVSESLMTLLRDNPIAIANGDSGAPKVKLAAMDTDSVDSAKIKTDAVGSSEIAANVVGQSELKTTYQTLSNPYASSQYTLTGAGYNLGFTLQGANSYILDLAWYNASAASTFVAKVKIDAGSATEDDSRAYYVNSSPPYDLGDGDIPLFVYAIMDNATSDIEAMSISPDPIWAYNGPTNIVPTSYRKDGTAYQERKDMREFPLTLAESIAAGGIAYRDYLRAFKDAPTYVIEITQSIKNADMNIIPHPFEGNDLTGKTVVMLDPMADELQDLLAIREYDSQDNDASDAYILRNYMTIGNTNLSRSAPDGILVPSLKWKNTI